VNRWDDMPFCELAFNDFVSMRFGISLPVQLSHSVTPLTNYKAHPAILLIAFLVIGFLIPDECPAETARLNEAEQWGITQITAGNIANLKTRFPEGREKRKLSAVGQGSLKSPLCLCTSISLPAASYTLITATWRPEENCRISSQVCLDLRND